MRRTFLLSVAVISGSFALLGDTAHAATRPRTGGTLRVLTAAQPKVLDPRNLPVELHERAAAEMVSRLLFDKLVTFDEKGQPQPALATNWNHDAAFKRWTFDIRAGVNFTDGAPLTAEMVAAVLRSIPGGPSASASGTSVIVEGPSENPDLLRDFASEQFAILRVGEDGVLLGTGAFRLAEWQPGKRALLTAKENHWRGRAFLDDIEVEMGVTPREQMAALALGKADLIEVGPADARRVAQGGHRVWSSLPNELLAIVFQPGSRVATDAQVREAIARSIDRGAIHSVLLQKQGEPAGGLLPQWLSGYAFLFSTAQDLPRARAIAAALPPERLSLTLGYDFADGLAESIAERIAVNARDAGIALKTTALATSAATSSATSAAVPVARSTVDARLQRVGIEDLNASAALVEMVTASLVLDWKHPIGPVAPEVLYSEERQLLEGYQIIPLFHLPQIYGLSARVKNWTPLPAGTWRLEDVWLGAEKP